MEWAVNTGRLRDRLSPLPVQPGDTILAGHTKVNQRPSVLYPRLTVVFHPLNLVQGYADPVLDQDTLPR